MTPQPASPARSGVLIAQLPQPKAVNAAKKARAGQRKATAMRWLRRSHLYSGLLLLPWVLVYGISGFLFNHGGSTTSTRMVPIPANQLAQLTPDQQELGARLLTAVEQQDAKSHATVTGSWTFEFHEPVTDKSYRLSLPIDESVARLSERRRRSSNSTSYARDTFAPERELAEQAARATLSSISLQHEDLRAIGGPTLRVSSDQSRWSTTLTRDRATESAASAFDLNRLMRRLHVTHGYNRSDWSRIAWAVIVDVMAFAMVLWAISGIAMWWQKKSLRASGAVALTAAFTGAAVLIIALQAVFNT
jgi:hypothetical protein